MPCVWKEVSKANFLNKVHSCAEVPCKCEKKLRTRDLQQKAEGMSHIWLDFVSECFGSM